MKKIFPLILILLAAIATHAQTFYVAPGGASILSTNINAPGSIAFAFTNAPKHTTVYVKAGNYTGLNLTVGNDSTTFIGYRVTPGDLTVADVPNSLNTFLNNQNLFISKFPVLKGNDRSTGIGINISKKRNVTFKNFLR